MESQKYLNDLIGKYKHMKLNLQSDQESVKVQQE